MRCNLSLPEDKADPCKHDTMPGVVGQHCRASGCLGGMGYPRRQIYLVCTCRTGATGTRHVSVVSIHGVTGCRVLSLPGAVPWRALQTVHGRPA